MELGSQSYHHVKVNLPTTCASPEVPRMKCGSICLLFDFSLGMLRADKPTNHIGLLTNRIVRQQICVISNCKFAGICGGRNRLSSSSSVALDIIVLTRDIENKSWTKYPFLAYRERNLLLILPGLNLYFLIF